MSANTKTKYGPQSKYLPEQLRDIDLAFEEIMRWEQWSMTITQGSWSGSVSASAGTHSGADGQDLTPYEERAKEKFLRILGCMHYIRPAIARVWSRHNHGGRDYSTGGSPGFKSQLVAYHRRENALANRGPDTGYRMLVFPKNIYKGYKGYVRAHKGFHAWEQQTYKSNRKRAYERGELIRVVAETEVAGQRWYITINGECILASKCDKVKYTSRKLVGTYQVVKAVQGYSQPWSGAAKTGAVRQPGYGVKFAKLLNVSGNLWATSGNGIYYPYNSFALTNVAKPKLLNVRPMSYNFPGPDKRGDVAKRVTAGVALMKKGTPSFIGLQELVGPVFAENGTRKPSEYAQQIITKFGTGYSLITPTKAFNENYAILNLSEVKLLKQYEDVILTSDAGGRHITRMLLQDLATGLPFAVGVTHLKDGATNDAARLEQSEQAAAAMEPISEANGDCPVIILGDMNQPNKDLQGFLDQGLVNVRKTAKATTNGTYPTYFSWSVTTPTIKNGKLFDYIYASKGVVVNGFTVLLGTTTTGKFPVVRPSDHVPVLASLTFTIFV